MNYQRIVEAAVLMNSDSEEQIDEAFSQLEAPEIPSAMIARKLLQGKGSGKDKQPDGVEQSAGDGEDAGLGTAIAALTTLVQQMRQRGFANGQLDDLLAANLSFTSNDLTELAAQINQFAAAWLAAALPAFLRNLPTTR
jgi:hypothetical protein